MNSIFRCPRCKKPVDVKRELQEANCAACGFATPIADGIPTLVADHEETRRQIEQMADSRKGAWFSEPQASQFEGPYRHHVAKRRKYVESWLARKTAGGPAETALDLGCGDGSNFFWLSKYAHTLYGSDYNLMRLRRASEKNIAELVFMADATDYPAETGSFDIIYFNHVLEHIPDDAAALKEACRILRDDGMLVLGIPNEGAAFWRLAYKLQPDILKSSDHVHFYTAPDIEQKCTAAGFRILETHHIGWGVPHWALDARLRGFKSIDDAFEKIGRALLKNQATSLYLILTK